MRLRTIVFPARLSGAPVVLFLICLLAAFAPVATANPVAIQDASFDNRSLSSGGVSTTLTPWQETAGPGNANGSIDRLLGFAGDGQNHLGVNLNHSVWQDLGVTYQAHTRYTLTVAVGNRYGYTQTGNRSRYLLAASDGTVFATGSINAWIQKQGTFADPPPLVFETGSDSSAIGKTIRILLEAGGSGRSHFDKIRLTAVWMPPPLATTLAATEVTYTSAILNGMVNAKGSDSTVFFEHGPTSAFGSILPATPFRIAGNADTAVSFTLNGLSPATTYHYRVGATNQFGTHRGTDLTFTTGTPPYLSRLVVSEGTLTPSFSPTVSNYTLQVPATTTAIGITPETEHANAILNVQGVELSSGATSDPIPLNVGNTIITVGIKEAGASLIYKHVINVIRPPGTFVFTSADKPAFSAHSFDPTGRSIELALDFAPRPGTTLTILENPGLAWMKGRFDNLAHGEVVQLDHNGVRYAMVADYHGGDGNDLVLKWAHTSLFGWGFNDTAQVGDGTTIFRNMPVPVDTTGGLAGKVVMDVISGNGKTFALCADGSIFQWVADKPAEFQKTGALEGKRVVSIAIGNEHQLALCDDGTLAVWGFNTNGVFGPAVPSWSSGGQTPLKVPMVGVLEGKTIVAIACGTNHNLILCEDGSLIAWGNNERGQLGNGTTAWTVSNPVLVDQSGVLFGKKVVSISAGYYFSMALFDDGTVAAWGTNDDGQLGIGDSSVGRAEVPVLINHEPFAGKPVVAISCGRDHSLALCSDGKVFGWGKNLDGQLGNSTSARAISPTPVAADQGDVLVNRKVIGISAQGYSSLAICEDGVAADWGSAGVYNNYYRYPRLLEIAGLGSGNPVTGGVRGLGSGIIEVALHPAPVVSTGDAHSITDQSAVLAGSVNPNGGAVRCYIELGPTRNYGDVIEADPATADGVTGIDIAALADQLENGSTYHYRLVAEMPGGRIFGEDKTFTTTSLAALTSLETDHGSIWPVFNATNTSYDLVVPNDVESILFHLVAASESAAVSVNGVAVGTGGGVATIPVPLGSQTVNITVDAVDGINILTYQARVIRLPGVFVLNEPGWEPIMVNGFTASGEIGIELGFAPAVGTEFTLVRNTGLAPIEGGFSNLPQGKLIHLEHEGVRYPFVVNYHGENGNDLVLQWAQTRLAAWGTNSSGQLGVSEGGVGNKSTKPVAVDASGILQGKTVIHVATGGGSNLDEGFAVAICSDGTIATWGNNRDGQLGNGTKSGRLVPGGMVQDGALTGQMPFAAAAGQGHVLVLCSDGSLVSWGGNARGQLGTGDTTHRLEPVLINATGPLAGQRIIAIAAAYQSSYALCADGTLFSWGYNESAQLNDGTQPGLLGDGTNTNRLLPVQVDQTGILQGQKIVAIVPGIEHVHVLCENGRVAGWGRSSMGSLGTGSTASSNVPRWADHSGVLFGRPVVALKAGNSFSLALCADGVIASWGVGESGQLGSPTGGGNMISPALVDMTGVLAGKTITSLGAGVRFGLALASDGTLASWGNNYGGMLGIGANSGVRTTPVEVNTEILRPGECFSGIFTSGTSPFSLALIAGPPAPEAITLAASGIIDSAATLNARIHPNANENVAVFFELWESGVEDPVRVLPASPDLVSGTGHVEVEARVSGLKPNTIYQYRALTESVRGRIPGAEMAFTTSRDAVLSALNLSAGQMAEVFSEKRFGYTLMVAMGVESTTVTPVAANPSTTIMVNGESVPSGVASAPIALAAGANEIVITVTAEDPTNVLTYTIVITRLPERFELTDQGTTPVSAGSVTLNGVEAILSLEFAPASGHNFTLIENTGFEPISDTFANIAQGDIVELEYEGLFYRFIADYHGGDGNDLVLYWANNRLLAWGANGQGQLGRGGLISSNIPARVDPGGIIAGRSILRHTSNGSRNLVLCADGSLYQWGQDTVGTFQNSQLPVFVDQTGAMNGKRVTQIAVGSSHSLVLCSDGSLYTWGRNSDRQLGNPSASFTGTSTPMPVDQSGVLAGKRILAIAAGGAHNVVLCTDGTLAVWGGNGSRQLADGTTTNRSSPILVKRGGVLAGKQPAAIRAGGSHSLVVCSDGTLASWGLNNNGQLGTSISPLPPEPVLVDRSGILSNKEIIKLAAGGSHNLALCSDGTLAAWGYNINGGLGDGSTTTRVSPVAVSHFGQFEGSEVVSMAGGSRHSIVVTSDGRAFSWGGNFDGQLGNGTNGNSTHSTSPVEVDESMFVPGERFTGVSSGSNHNLAMASLLPPSATALPADDITGTSVTLSGRVLSSGNTLRLTFEYGENDNFDSVTEATPDSVSGLPETDVSCSLTGLKPGTTYHFRVVAKNYGSVARSQSMTFTTLSDNARLAGITNRLSNRRPAFHPETFAYIASVDFDQSELEMRPVTQHPGASVTINGIAVPHGSFSPPLPLAVGNNTLTVVVTAEDGITTLTYTTVVTRLPEFFDLAIDGAPVTSNGFSAKWRNAPLRLNFHPPLGTSLMVVDNTALGFIHDEFENLKHGQRVWLSHEGVWYAFVANYYGGTGNDLVLQWAGTRMAGWGMNNYGQLGDGGTTRRLAPVAVDDTGVLADKTIFAVATGYLHSVALCSDGTLASWGYNVQGQLGDNGSTHQNVPVAVDTSGVLANKMVVAIASGSYHNLALCADGTVAAWGFNNHGQLGDGTQTTARTPVLVNTEGVLAGKQVVAVAAGAYQSYALCSDGTIAAWGYNDEGELGDGGNTSSLVPVAVDVSGALAGRKVASIAAGQYHTLALCTDGTVVSWGYNQRGQLGNSSTTDSASPVEIGSFGALDGKNVKAIAAGASHSLALCTDGTLAAWGLNSQSQLGGTGMSQSSTPVAVVPPAHMTGRAMTSITTGAHHNLLRFTDGGMAAWGGNANGQLGDNTTQASSAVVDVDTSALEHGGFIMFAASGCASSHNLAVFAIPVDEPTDFEAWHMEHFGETAFETANADPIGDFDGDCMPNLVEYAFGLDPLVNCGGKPPQPHRNGDRFEIRFSRALTAPDIDYGAEWSPDLSPGSWLDVPDSGSGDEHLFSVPVDSAPRLFMRHRVRVR